MVISGQLTILGSKILNRQIPVVDVGELELPAGSGQTAVVALVAQLCHSQQNLAVPEAWEAAVKGEFGIQVSDHVDPVLNSSDTASYSNDVVPKRLKREPSSEVVRDSPTSDLVTSADSTKFEDVLGDLKHQIDGYETNMIRLESSNTELNTRFGDMVRRHRIEIQGQEYINKELTEINRDLIESIRGLKETVRNQGILIKKLEQRLDVAIGRGESTGSSVV